MGSYWRLYKETFCRKSYRDTCYSWRNSITNIYHSNKVIIWYNTKFRKTARGLIQTSGAGSQLASLVTGLVLLWVAKGLYSANGEIDKEYNEELFKEENKGKQASEILNEIRNRAIENGEISKVIMSSVQGLGASIAEFFIQIKKNYEK